MVADETNGAGRYGHPGASLPVHVAPRRQISLALGVLSAACAVLALPGGIAPASTRRPAPLPGAVAARIVQIARAELARGVRESPAGSNQGARIREYVRSTTPSAYPNPWCAYFASWVARRAGAPIGPGGRGLGATGAVQAWALRTGRWHHTPRAGNLIVEPGHVGVVVAVSSARHTLVSIEGNYSDRVSSVGHGWGDALGYVRVTPTWSPDPPLRARFVVHPGPALRIGQTVHLFATASTGDIASYSWDLDGDGRYGDAHGRVVTRAYARARVVRAGLRITSRRGKVAERHLRLTIAAPVAAAPPDGR